MGLLSRKKTPAQTAPPPAISAPLASSTIPAVSSSDYSHSSKLASQPHPDTVQHKYPVQSQPSGLPSPPRSPVDELSQGCKLIVFPLQSFVRSEGSNYA